jgi:hypothetical protein
VSNHPEKYTSAFLMLCLAFSYGKSILTKTVDNLEVRMLIRGSVRQRDEVLIIGSVRQSDEVLIRGYVLQRDEVLIK